MENQIQKNENFNFDNMCDFYIQLGSISSPSDLHGQICGNFAAGKNLNENDFMSLATIQIECDSIFDEKS